MDIESLSPEMQLIIHCCQYALSRKHFVVQRSEIEPGTARLDSLPDVHLAPDWNKFIAKIDQHGVASLVCLAVNEIPTLPIPPEIRRILQERNAASVRWGMYQTLELVRLVRRFQENALPMTVLKGVTLSHRLFGDVAMRTSTDIDILVEPSTLQKAEQILIAAGYQCQNPGFQLTPRQRRALMFAWNHIHYEHPARQVMIELHWRPYSQEFLPDDYIAEMINKVQMIQIGSQSLPCLSDDDLLLFLCLHGAKHEWTALKWLCDIAALLNAKPSIIWDDWCAKLTSYKLEKLVGEALLLAQEFLNADLPTELMPLTEAAGNRQEILARYATAYTSYSPELMEGGKINTTKFHSAVAGLTHLQTSGKWWHTLHQWWIMPDDWRVIQLPDSLFSLYYVLRPILWVWRYYLQRKSTTAPPT